METQNFPGIGRKIPGLAGHSLITDTEREAVLDIIPQSSPGGHFLEIGTFAGATLAYWADRRPNVTFQSIDIFESWRKHHKGPEALVAWHDNNATSGRTNRRLFVGTSEQFAAICRPEMFSIAFVDGDHSRGGCYRDLAAVIPLMLYGGTIACHDYGSKRHPGVAEAVDQFRLEAGFHIVNRVESVVFLQRAISGHRGDS